MRNSDDAALLGQIAAAGGTCVIVGSGRKWTATGQTDTGVPIEATGTTKAAALLTFYDRYIEAEKAAAADRDDDDLGPVLNPDGTASAATIEMLTGQKPSKKAKAQVIWEDDADGIKAAGEKHLAKKAKAAPAARKAKAPKVAHPCNCTAALAADPALADVGFKACDGMTFGTWTVGHDARFHAAQKRNSAAGVASMAKAMAILNEKAAPAPKVAPKARAKKAAPKGEEVVAA